MSSSSTTPDNQDNTLSPADLKILFENCIFCGDSEIESLSCSYHKWILEALQAPLANHKIVDANYFRDDYRFYSSYSKLGFNKPERTTCLCELSEATLQTILVAEALKRRHPGINVTELIELAEAASKRINALPLEEFVTRGCYGNKTPLNQNSTFAYAQIHDLPGDEPEKVAEQLGVEEDEVMPAASFVDDLNTDSLDLVEE